MAGFTVKIETKGPLFKATKKSFERGVSVGLSEIGANGMALVLSQLSKGHGVRSGNLKAAVRYYPEGDDTVIIDVNERFNGKDINYADWIESGGKHPRWGTMSRFRGYQMFENAEASLLRGNGAGKEMAKRIADQLDGKQMAQFKRVMKGVSL
tara:strand:- start:24 stop:482 length:459 start_codon:yes stop_codon:yes gene_type:complete